MVKEEGKIREFPKQAIKTAEKGEKQSKPFLLPCKYLEKQ